MAAALLAAGQALRDPQLVDQAVQVAVDCTDNARASAYPVRSAGLCHGAAGIGHTFNAMYQAAGDARLRAASCWWFAELLRHDRRVDAGGGSRHRPHPDAGGTVGWGEGDGLLSGAAGVALALLAASTSDRPAWDAVLLVGAGHKPGSG